ncbi:MAG: hypothetical protein HKO75_03030 [Flavobacteriaceae bacterium]|nr:hypothetical protein [Muriicola sp.]MBT8289335.1 hypothetical protein [Muriicola sp.]NNC62369.1 hypothetical protein [Eudoraea sp.]NNK34527.1 hypothetical protein [Eudoraea sp.]NNL38812.1 hypothetical protein [Flavobacteriaceae bacterium]
MKTSGVSLLFAFIFLVFACSKSDNSEGVDMNDPNSEDPDATTLSYQNDVRPIIQGNCLSCHGNPPTNNAPMSLTTLSLVKSAIENRNLLSRINNTTNPMPPDGLMPQSARQLIADWATQGFPE